MSDISYGRHPATERDRATEALHVSLMDDYM